MDLFIGGGSVQRTATNVALQNQGPAQITQAPAIENTPADDSTLPADNTSAGTHTAQLPESGNLQINMSPDSISTDTNVNTIGLRPETTIAQSNNSDVNATSSSTSLDNVSTIPLVQPGAITQESNSLFISMAPELYEYLESLAPAPVKLQVAPAQDFSLQDDNIIWQNW